MTRRPLYAHRCLLVATDDDPSLLLLTLQALPIGRRNRLNEVRTLSTAAGVERMKNEVHGREEGAFFRYRALNYPRLRFDWSAIGAFTAPDGSVVPSLKRPIDVAAAAESLVTRLRDLTQSKDTSVLLALEAGSPLVRWAAMGMSLFGRPQDEMVLLPPTRPRAAGADSSDDTGDLFTFTVPQCRSELPAETLDSKELVRAEWLTRQLSDGVLQSGSIPKSLDSLLIFNLASRQILCRGRLIHLKPGDFAVYLWLARRRLALLPEMKTVDPVPLEDILDAYRSVLSHGGLQKPKGSSVKVDVMRECLLSDFPKFFREARCRIDKELAFILGKEGCAPFVIAQSGKRPNHAYQIASEPENIRIQLGPVSESKDKPENNEEKNLQQSVKKRPNSV